MAVRRGSEKWGSREAIIPRRRRRRRLRLRLPHFDPKCEVERGQTQPPITALRGIGSIDQQAKFCHNADNRVGARMAPALSISAAVLWLTALSSVLIDLAEANLRCYSCAPCNEFEFFAGDVHHFEVPRVGAGSVG